MADPWGQDTRKFDETDHAEPPAAPPEPWLGKCLADANVTGDGHCLIGYADVQGRACRVWALCLRHVDVVSGDRVLLLSCVNSDAPVVVGVVDSPPREVANPARANPRITLAPNESLQVVAANGVDLLRVSQTEAGPCVRLCQADIQLDLPGEFHLSAEQVSFSARQGEMRLAASEDVIVKGRTIRLN